MSDIPSFVTMLMTRDSPSLASVFGPQQWGIFGQGGQPVLVSESVAAVEYARDYAISDYPQEQGAFESYNKVQNPFQAKVTLLSNQTRAQLLNALEAATYSLSLVSVVTPEVTYPSANITRYSLRRTSRSGVTLIAVDIWLEEVRQDAGTQLSSTNPQAASANGGTPSPIGQLSPGANVAAGSSSTSNYTSLGTSQPITLSTSTPADLAAGTGAFALPPASAINASSTNAAFPTQSGPVQTQSAAQASAFLGGSLGGIPLPTPH